jgi:uncharacterized protein
MMKYLLVLAVVMLILWLARAGRRSSPRRGGKPSAPGPAPAEDMVRCAHCGVHLPRHDALVGAASALYCSAAHRVAGPAQP